MVRLVILASCLLTSCSYGPSFRDCTVVCSSPEECPAGFTCGGEGFCRSTGGDTCADILGDAGAPDDTPPSESCFGTPATCATFLAMSDCLDHTGCSFTLATCTITTNCSAITTNQQCENTPGCATDFTTSTCKAVAGYCHGSTEMACETLHDPNDCVYAGGCTGTPNPCESYTNESDCRTTAGCNWQ